MAQAKGDVTYCASCGKDAAFDREEIRDDGTIICPKCGTVRAVGPAPRAARERGGPARPAGRS